MMGQYYGYGGMFGFGWILNIIFWVVIIWLIVAVMRGRTWHNCGPGGCHHNNKEDDSMSILKERYAKGEITKEDFERMKKDLA